MSETGKCWRRDADVRTECTVPNRSAITRPVLERRSRQHRKRLPPVAVPSDVAGGPERAEKVMRPLQLTELPRFACTAMPTDISEGSTPMPPKPIRRNHEMGRRDFLDSMLTMCHAQNES